MKTQYIIIATIFSVGALAAWALWPSGHEGVPVNPMPRIKPATTASLPLVAAPLDVPKPTIHKFKFGPDLTPDEEAMLRWRHAMMAKDPAFDWKQPIKFYALVIDQNNQPLPGATASWITTNMHVNGEGTAISDSSGRFFIDTSGKNMGVKVRKDGYRTVEANAPFEFADFTRPEYYDGDYNHPYIFHLRKIPTPEPIYFRTGIWRDNVANNKLAIDPVTGQQSFAPGPQGIWFELKTETNSVPGNEVYKIIVGTASGEGVCLVDGDTDEQAPTSGYSNPLDTGLNLKFDHGRYIQRKLFFKDGSGNYGSVELDAEIGDHNPTVSYYLKYNPNGGTSLTAQPHGPLQINKNAY
jgi:hypothetical protein